MTAGVRETAVPGRTVVTVRALQRLATGLAGEAAQVPAGDVSVRLTDADGSLRVAVTVPISLGGDDTIVERGDGVRARVREGMLRLGDREVRSVDVRFAGVRRPPERRVR